MSATANRGEVRTPMKVNVDLASQDIRTPAQKGVTENVSSHGVRVVTSRAWRPNDLLTVRSLVGNFRSRARVVYCEQLARGFFAIGLYLSISAGKWMAASR